MLIGVKKAKPSLISEQYHAEYRIENDEVEFVKYIGNEDEYQVPAEIDGYPVTRIGKYAFAEMRNLIFVKLPLEIQTIGAHAFYNCRAIERLEFGDRLKDIEDGAFKNCEMLHHIILRTTTDSRLNIKNILAGAKAATKLLMQAGYSNSDIFTIKGGAKNPFIVRAISPFVSITSISS